ncbi:reverse transcriptase domain-containing protein [Tanacetum coccineum]
MVAPDWNLSFELICDASDYAVGVVLGQPREKKFQPIYYASKTLNEAQQNYTTTKKELLAVDKSGAENVVADHLSRLKNPHAEKLNKSDINNRFPYESLMYADGNDEYPWFADIINYLARGTLLKGISYQQKINSLLILRIAPLIANQNANQNGNGNVVAARAKGNTNGNNGNQIRSTLQGRRQ